MIISFGWTAQYLPPHGPKDTTRRIWKPRTIAAWQKAWDDLWMQCYSIEDVAKEVNSSSSDIGRNFSQLGNVADLGKSEQSAGESSTTQ